MPTDPRVLLVSATPPPEGGVASWTAAFLGLAPRHGIGVELFETRMRGGRWSLQGIGRLLRVTLGPLGSILAGRGRQADVVHVCAGVGGGLLRATVIALVARAAGKGAVVHLHSRIGNGDAFETATARRAARRGVVYVTPNQTDADRHEFLQWIGNFVAPEFGAGGQWTLPSTGNGLRLVYLGWLIHAKGLGELIRAVARVPGVTVDLVGPPIRPAEARDLAALVESERVGDRVRILDPVPATEVPSVMRRYDALILPSHEESFGMVVAEAMALGVPVIGTRTGVLEQMPADAFVVAPVRDVDGLADVLRTVAAARDGLRGVGERGRRHAERHFTAEAAMRKWRALYQGLYQPSASDRRTQPAQGRQGS
ncbi:MAG: glycosyltransferase family 4 protein [Gemmatimonadales bacterium]|nr:glycosyltransferase family 4 protein [Gemmatimonadales bacterium]